jgi:hypothetical protein
MFVTEERDASPGLRTWGEVGSRFNTFDYASVTAAFNIWYYGSSK